MNNEFAHHGILGQRWGHRNGPPYPLGSGDHSASERKAGWRKSLKNPVVRSDYKQKSPAEIEKEQREKTRVKLERKINRLSKKEALTSNKSVDRIGRYKNRSLLRTPFADLIANPRYQDKLKGLIAEAKRQGWNVDKTDMKQIVRGEAIVQNIASVASGVSVGMLTRSVPIGLFVGGLGINNDMETKYQQYKLSEKSNKEKVKESENKTKFSWENVEKMTGFKKDSYGNIELPSSYKKALEYYDSIGQDAPIPDELLKLMNE